MKKLLAISILLLSLCNMSVVRCALMRLGDNSGDGMSRVVVSEDAELRGQADHANHLCRLTRYIRAIIDGYAAGPHLLPKIHVDPKRLVERDGKKGVEISTKEGEIFLPSERDLKFASDLFGDSTGLLGVIIDKRLGFYYGLSYEEIKYTIFQETYVNVPQKNISCITRTPFPFLNKATAACMQVIETAEGKKEYQIFTPLIEGEKEEEAYSAPCWDTLHQNEKSGASLKRKIGLRPGYVEGLAAIAIPFQVKNEKKTKKRKREAANPSLLFDH